MRGMIPGRAERVPGWLVLLAAAAVAEYALLAAWQRNGYWSFSDGVNLLSGREFLHGRVPYRDFAAAQPPAIYLVGAGLLWIDDGLAGARAGLAVVGLITAALVGRAVWRLCGRRDLTAVAVLVAPLTPIALYDHSQLLPETLAAPLLLGAALLRGRRERAAGCALLLVLACGCKLAFALPALAIIAAGPERRRLSVWCAAIGALGVAAALLVFGADLWREAVLAQLQIGRTPLHQFAGALAQGAWNELPLIGLAGAGLWWAWRGGGPEENAALLMPLVATAAAGLVLALSILKRGSYVEVLGPAEPPLLALAVGGAGAWWSARRAVGALGAVLAGWLALQPLSMLTSPQAPWAATRPLAASGLSWTASPATVDRMSAQARRCPARAPYSGSPYLAFLNGRRMPGDQPDTFIIQAADNARFALVAAADTPTCPGR